MKFDIIIVGAGHAGIEAAYIASKKNVSVLMITGHLDLIGQMSCNPSIGGVSKGNIVREIDALGGCMAKNIDKTGIHFKMLNTSKGMAVWGNRAQADKFEYRKEAKRILEERKNIFFLQSYVIDVIEKGGTASGVIVDSGEKIESSAIILTNGTFLNGTIHIGLNNYSGGRIGEPSSIKLTESLNSYGIKSGRLKTGTSPRLDARTIDFSKFDRQDGDTDPWPFSYSTENKIENKTSCWIGKTNKNTHKIIIENLDRSPLYSGKIKSIGPKYCPSIEDKIIRFGERDGHSLFLEPESITNNEIYVNGLATSLPFDVQNEMIHSIPGLENTKILRPGYAIEYDYFQPIQLNSFLESKIIKNLYFAGQINGTSGYEEAAGQGIIAGINAVQKILGEEQIIIGRDKAYIGVLIDDLIKKGTEEPYRMFTSRAEHRLQLRQDNSDERLMPISVRLGFLEKEIYEKREKVWNCKKSIKKRIREDKIKIEDRKYTIAELLKRPEITIEKLKEFSYIINEDRKVVLSVQADIKYEGFEEKENNTVKYLNKIESTKIPINFDYKNFEGILKDSRNKLEKVRPENIGQASRIPGITPSDIYNLAIYISNHNVSRETSGRNV